MTNETPNRLPTLTYKGKEYFIDMRLKEFRPVDIPFESIAFDSELGREIDLAHITINCDKCNKILFQGSEKEANGQAIYCPDCAQKKTH